MTTKKRKKQKSGRPPNWREICMARVPAKGSQPAEPEKVEEAPEPDKQ